LAGNPWTARIEPKGDGANYIHKLLFTDGIDRRIKLPAADALRNLRAALDQLTAASARLNGAPRLNGLHFPFLDDPSSWEKVIKRKCRFVPQPVIDFFGSLRPYKGGDDDLRVLNSLRNDNDHWALTDILLTVSDVAVTRPGQRQQVIAFPEWPTSGINEVELFTAPSAESDYSLAVVIKIGFKIVPALAGTPEMILRNLSKKVVEIVDRTEGIMRREGFPV